MYSPIEGGSIVKVGFDDEFIDCWLPPVGKCLDRMPDPETGKPSMELVDCDILFDDAPIKDRKWNFKPHISQKLPNKWGKWSADEKVAQKADPEYLHPEAEKFRKQEWTRRLNGVWMSIGNRSGKNAEYVYLTGLAYLYFQWWRCSFGYPKFRFTYLKVFYSLQWSKDCPYSAGVALSTLRRYGKTAIAGCWSFDEVSRLANCKTGIQAQNLKDAKMKFQENVVYSWRYLPDFFRPLHDHHSAQTNELQFRKATPRGAKNVDYFGEKVEGLHSVIDYRETTSTAYDGQKLRNYWVEEGGKWHPGDVYKTLNVVLPAMTEGVKIYGQAFVPTTIEEENEGGDEFIRLFEDSFPSLMAKNTSNRTNSNLIALFISAEEGYIYDEYGRSVIEDPLEKEDIYNEDGEKVEIGARNKILQLRKDKEGDPGELAQITRKFPLSWSEAKLMGTEKCHFNAMLLSGRLNELNSLINPLYIKGNFHWVGEKDGNVEFIRDDHNGRWAMSWLPDKTGATDVDTNQIINRVKYEVDYDTGNKRYRPMNDRLFAIGSDPIRYTKTDDPRASKASAYIFRKFDAEADLGRPQSKWKSYNFIGEYLVRPDFEVYGEDMIMACRFFGCSILPEDNVSSLRQYFDDRGYGRFILYRRDFDDNVLKLDKDNDKAVDSNLIVIDTYMRKLNAFFNKNIDRIVFPNLLKQALKFDLAKPTRFDAVVGAGYTLIAAEKREREEDEEEVKEEQMFPVYSQSGSRSKLNTG